MSYRHRFSRRWRINQVTPETILEDRVICAICGFRGVPIDDPPREDLGAKPTQTTGSTYVWTAANESVTTLDKTVVVLDQVGTCPFCHGEQFLDGRRGSALRVP